MRRWLPLSLLVCAATAVEPAWDHLPWAVYSEEQLDLAGELPAGWTIVRGAERLRLDPTSGLQLPAQGPERLRLADAAGEEAGALRLLRPGDGGALQFVDGRLRCDGDLVVLTLSRLEHVEDRRWLVLRAARSDEAIRCRTRLSAPETALGESGLLAQIAAARLAPVWKEGVVVELPASDRLVGWNHRAYRQALAWLVADLWRRGAARVVLVQAPVVAAERAAIEPFWDQARDVATTYRCDLVEVQSLLAERYWRIGEHLLGDRLNAAGRAELDRLCAGYLRDG